MDHFKAIYFKEKLNPKQMERIFERKAEASIDLGLQQTKKNVYESISNKKCVAISPNDNHIRERESVKRDLMFSSTATSRMHDYTSRHSST